VTEEKKREDRQAGAWGKKGERERGVRPKERAAAARQEKGERAGKTLPPRKGKKGGRADQQRKGKGKKGKGEKKGVRPSADADTQAYLLGLRKGKKRRSRRVPMRGGKEGGGRSASPRFPKGRGKGNTIPSVKGGKKKKRNCLRP